MSIHSPHAKNVSSGYVTTKMMIMLFHKLRSKTGNRKFEAKIWLKFSFIYLFTLLQWQCTINLLIKREKYTGHFNFPCREIDEDTFPYFIKVFLHTEPIARKVINEVSYKLQNHIELHGWSSVWTLDLTAAGESLTAIMSEAYLFAYLYPLQKVSAGIHCRPVPISPLCSFIITPTVLKSHC